MTASNGQGPAAPLDVGEVLQLRVEDGSTLEYEVRAIFEDAEAHVSYAVLERESDGEGDGDGDGDREVIVTDLDGNLIDDEDLVRDVLENYDVFSEEAGDSGGAG
ncbi:MAG: hypothetical protein WCD38_12255 [Candidatus Tumulicola sp.]